MFSRVAETYCTLTNKTWGFQFLCIFTIAWYYQYFLKHSNSYGQFPHDGLFILFYLNLWPHPVASEILVPWPRIESTSLALEGRALIMGPPGKSRHMMVLIHLSLMTYDIQHLIMCLSSVYPLWLNVYANISPIFKGFFFLIFSLLSFVNLLRIFYTSHLPDMWFFNTFS